MRAGEGYLDSGDHGHIGRNLGGVPARDVTVYQPSYSSILLLHHNRHRRVAAAMRRRTSSNQSSVTMTFGSFPVDCVKTK